MTLTFRKIIVAAIAALTFMAVHFVVNLAIGSPELPVGPGSSFFAGAIFASLWWE